MRIWALADLHLAIGVPEKTMSVFGPQWEGYHEKIAFQWQKLVANEDLVLIAGDISWAMYPAQAQLDLEWIDHLPGQKVLIKGNHDYWWSSLNKLKAILPPSCHLIQNNAFHFHQIAVAGTRLWDTQRFQFLIEETVEKTEQQYAEDERIFNRELARLEMSLQQIKKEAEYRIVMTHYPPVPYSIQKTVVTDLLEKYNVDICIFGHIHAKTVASPYIGELNGVKYYLTSSDLLHFTPYCISNIHLKNK